jgi:hypothetical protein
MKYAVEMISGGMANVPSFMNIGEGIQRVLRFRVDILKGCIVPISEGNNSTPL